MRFYYIRHAQSENNALWDHTGVDLGRKEDPALTNLGWEHAKLGARVAAGNDAGESGFGLTHLYCSPMLRAAATAYEIAKTTGVMPVVWKDWHECGGLFSGSRAGGDIVPKPGMSKAQLEERFPGIIINGEVGSDGWWHGEFEGEEQRKARGVRVLAELLERHKNTNHVVVVVSHGGFYQKFAAALMGVEKLEQVWLLMNNTGVTRVDFENGETTLVFHNMLRHLSQEQVS